MSLKAVMDSIDDLPDPIKELYSERDGKYELTGIAGVKSEEDVRRLQSALEKERTDHRSTRDKFKPFAELDPEEVFSKLDRIPELEAAAAKELDEAALEEMAERRAATRIKPLERQLHGLTQREQELVAKVQEYETREQNRVIGESLLTAGKKLKMLDPEDAITFGRTAFLLNEHGEVVTEDGLSPEQFLTDLQAKKGHLWGPTAGGGARGGAGGGAGWANNPFSADNWNMTEQARIVRTQGMEIAERMAKAAGTKVGGSKPAKK